MFPKEVYQQRRQTLKEALKDTKALLLFPGNLHQPYNYPANVRYPFRQDSTFLYLFGLDLPNLFGVIDVETGDEIIFGNEVTIDDIIWSGNLPKLSDLAAEVGVSKVLPLSELSKFIAEARQKRRPIYFLPISQAEVKIWMSDLLGIAPQVINDYASELLIYVIVSMREIKDKYEIDEIVNSVIYAIQFHNIAMKVTVPGRYEKDIFSFVGSTALRFDYYFSFQPIITINGQILHNTTYDNELKAGRLLLVDMGFESLKSHYSSDLTRTFPVSGKFTQKQRDIYEIVLKANKEAIKMIKPDVYYKDVHLYAAKIIAQGLKDLGLLRGDVDDIVSNGAHALFFPHGLGHMMGLDVHDMEGLGEDYVGYDETVQRSDQFGLAFLRLAKKLKPGFVLTVEPGIYFIPELINLWKQQGKFKEFINYDKVEEYIDFGGIRIEDDVLVTDDGVMNLSDKLAKEVEEVEELIGQIKEV